MEEISGNLPFGNEIQGPAIGNISIGQGGSIEATPLQITNMMMIIVNNGIEKDISIIEGMTNINGNIIKKNIIEKKIGEYFQRIFVEFLRTI